MTLSKTAGLFGGGGGGGVGGERWVGSCGQPERCCTINSLVFIAKPPLMIFTANNCEHNHTLCCTTSRAVSDHTLISYLCSMKKCLFYVCAKADAYMEMQSHNNSSAPNVVHTHIPHTMCYPEHYLLEW